MAGLARPATSSLSLRFLSNEQARQREVASPDPGADGLDRLAAGHRRAVAAAFSTLRAGRNPQIPGQCIMISDEQPTLVVTCKLSPVYKRVVVETISDRARIIFLDELEQAAAR